MPGVPLVFAEALFTDNDIDTEKLVKGTFIKCLFTNPFAFGAHVLTASQEDDHSSTKTCST